MVLKSLGVLTIMCFTRSENQNKDLTKRQGFSFFLCVTEHLRLRIILPTCKKRSATLSRAKTNAKRKLPHNRPSYLSEQKLISISLDAILSFSLLNMTKKQSKIQIKNNKK